LFKGATGTSSTSEFAKEIGVFGELALACRGLPDNDLSIEKEASSPLRQVPRTPLAGSSKTPAGVFICRYTDSVLFLPRAKRAFLPEHTLRSAARSFRRPGDVAQPFDGHRCGAYLAEDEDRRQVPASISIPLLGYARDCSENRRPFSEWGFSGKKAM